MNSVIKYDSVILQRNQYHALLSIRDTNVIKQSIYKDKKHKKARNTYIYKNN